MVSRAVVFAGPGPAGGPERCSTRGSCARRTQRLIRAACSCAGCRAGQRAQPGAGARHGRAAKRVREVAKVALTRNEGDAVRARSGRLPQLSATATYDRSLANEFQGVFDNIDFGGGSGTAATTVDHRLLEPAVRPREHLARHAVVLAEPVFGRPDRRADRAGRDGRTRAAELGRDDGARPAAVRRDAGVLRRGAERAAWWRSPRRRSSRPAPRCGRSQAGFDAGTQPEFEVLRARVNRDNQTPRSSASA